MGKWYREIKMADGSVGLERCSAIESARAERWQVKTDLGDVWVSTVFLGLDHAYVAGPPVVYETMVFRSGDFDDLDCDRYHTRAEAEAGHAAMVAKWGANADR